MPLAFVEKIIMSRATWGELESGPNGKQLIKKLKLSFKDRKDFPLKLVNSDNDVLPASVRLVVPKRHPSAQVGFMFSIAVHK